MTHLYNWVSFPTKELERFSKEIARELEARKEIEKEKDWQQVAEAIQNYTNKHGNIKVETTHDDPIWIRKPLNLNNVGIIVY